MDLKVMAIATVMWLWAGVVTAQEDISDRVDAQGDAAVALAQKIWELAELGYQETQSSGALQAYLKEAGFSIRTPVAGIPTAFVAEAGGGPPTIGILAEFDALPGLSQQAVPEPKARVEGAAGHACGHHLFGAASAAAGVAIAQWLEARGRTGTVRVYGTPAEEGGSGKVYMAREGAFRGTDIVLHWHPGDRNDASPSSTTANKSGRFQFHGEAAHAAQAPERGRSALDAVEAMNYMVNLMREHMPQDARVHYVITDGGDAPNIVPNFAEVYYYVRHPDPEQVKALFERVVNVAEAAAKGTETRMAYEVMHGNYPVLPNDTLAKVVHQQMTRLGGLAYSPAERAFAVQIRETLRPSPLELGSEAQIQPFQFRQSMGSTDVGDVSWLVPTVGFRTATWVPGTPAHSWQAVAAGGMSIGHKGLRLASHVLAATAVEIYDNPRVLAGALEELNTRRGADFAYEALLGDRNPPLDYRK